MALNGEQLENHMLCQATMLMLRHIHEQKGLEDAKDTPRFSVTSTTYAIILDKSTFHEVIAIYFFSTADARSLTAC